MNFVAVRNWLRMRIAYRVMAGRVVCPDETALFKVENAREEKEKVEIGA
jgi:collagenase-like PrtC family protease